MKRLEEKLRLIRIKEGWGAFCLLGIIMLNYPFMHIFNKPNELVFGVPLMVLYLLVGWPISIFVIYLFSLYLVDPDAVDQTAEETDEESK